MNNNFKKLIGINKEKLFIYNSTTNEIISNNFREYPLRFRTTLSNVCENLDYLFYTLNKPLQNDADTIIVNNCRDGFSYKIQRIKPKDER